MIMQREIDPREEVIVHMRWLINYIRSCFCNHEWECLQNEIPVYESLIRNIQFDMNGYIDVRNVVVRK